MLVKDIMTKNVITVKKDASIREIAQTIVDHDISGLPVVDEEGKVCGIVSEGDLVRKEFAPELPDELCILGAVIYYSGLREYQDAFRKIAAISAEQLMTKKVVAVHEDDDVSKVAKIMYDKHVKRVPVLDGEKHLLGIVSRRDIVKMMLS
ncbi:CBS domain-containing protein [uncultured Mitsuokella sp.]|jgi:CBS domain-containing protein|uniref:CBS domain-containing protein n=1 Tax=uncultured Mitsuokella sp. TaxID=453120 RepID=UPI0025F1E558|nr:CBS domain-containing protein [uncultured Mitsuokella sp.]